MHHTQKYQRNSTLGGLSFRTNITQTKHTMLDVNSDKLVLQQVYNKWKYLKTIKTFKHEFKRQRIKKKT
jgi:hypothetical protein